MTLAQKLVLYALVVALVPLAAIGFSLVRIGEQALRERIQEHQLTAASALAAKTSQAVEEMANHISSVVARFDVTELPPREREGLMRLLYRQSPDISAVATLSAEGELLGEVLARSAEDGPWEDHPLSSAEHVENFIRHVPGLTAETPLAT